MLAERDFKGVWIPKEIWLDKNLTLLEKAIFAEIDSLGLNPDGCFAKNEYFAEMFDCSERKVSAAISKLMKIGYVEQAKFDGRNRWLRSCMRISFGVDTSVPGSITKFSMQDHEICYAGSRNVPPSYIYTNTPMDIPMSIPKSVSKENTLCAESQECASPQTVYQLPLNDGTMYAITQEDFTKYERLYPAVNVMAQLRKMDGWLDGNPQRRKTRKGIRKFVNNWLSNAQDSGKRESVAEKPAPPKPKYTRPRGEYGPSDGDYWNGMDRGQYYAAKTIEHLDDGTEIWVFPDGRKYNTVTRDFYFDD